MSGDVMEMTINDLPGRHIRLLERIMAPGATVHWEPIGERGVMVVAQEGVTVANPVAGTIHRLCDWGYLTERAEPDGRVWYEPTRKARREFTS